jgi:hypothetical protein
MHSTAPITVLHYLIWKSRVIATAGSRIQQVLFWKHASRNSSAVSERSRLAAARPPSIKVSHSRWHGLSESALRARGYEVLTKSKDAGVDIFAKRHRSQFFFFQGHPEYDCLSLQREYLRDIGRYLAGDQKFYPNIPEGYFDARTITALEKFRACALAERNPALIDSLPNLTLMPNVTANPDVTATTIFRNWLRYLAQSEARQSVQPITHPGNRPHQQKATISTTEPTSEAALDMKSTISTQAWPSKYATPPRPTAI